MTDDHGEAGSMEPEQTITVPCPVCGVRNPVGVEDFIGTAKRVGTSWLRATATATHISCDECHAERPVRDWQRAHEDAVFGALGVVTPRIMREAKASA